MGVFLEDVDGRWPFRPRPERDESFASWFCRTAWANGLSATELYPVALPGARLYRLDLDRFACDALIENLATYTGVGVHELWPRTFRTWTGSLFEHDDGQGKLLWLTPAGLRQHATSFGQQACPLCLREDGVPHLKRHWRLAFVTACETHGALLIDRCPACAAPIQPLYAPVSDGGMTLCWNCGFDQPAENRTR